VERILRKDVWSLQCDRSNVITRASLLSHLTFELARKPTVWAKLENEVGKLKSKLVDMKAIRSLKYVRYCLLEGKKYE
jgi:hypothetical protein